MVKLNKIYTRTGDDGTTGLVGGGRIPKYALRVEAYGTVDEASSAIGLCRLHCREVVKGHTQQFHDETLARIQQDLFDLGADLSTIEPFPGVEPLRIVQAQIDRLEQEIDAMNDGLPPLNSFILPGGTPLSAHLHLARTITRRAERITCHLAAEEEINPLCVQYLNRLSDHLFVMSRVTNGPANEVLWQPGANR